MDKNTHDTDTSSGLDLSSKDGNSRRNSDKLDVLVKNISELIKQNKLQDALEECDHALQFYLNHEKLLEKKIKILRQLGRFEEAYSSALQWLQKEPRNPTAIKEVKRLKVVIDALKDQESDEDEFGPASPKSVPTAYPVQKSVPAEVLQQPQVQTERASISAMKEEPRENGLYCTFCDETFESSGDLEVHCRSDKHKKRITSDEGHLWKFRPPPRGLSCDEYCLCDRYSSNGRCPFGDKCTQAHTREELEEWKERFKFKHQQIQRAREKRLHGNTYSEQLMERLMNAEHPKSVMVSNVEYAKVIVNSDLTVSMTTKKCTNAWTFTVTSKICLHRVVLLDEASGSYYYISSISVGPKKTQKYQNLENVCQEWQNPDIVSKSGEYVYRVKVVFKTDIYGTFRQTLVFDFGTEPVLTRDMQVESAPVTDTEKFKRDMELSEKGRWRSDNLRVEEFETKPMPLDDKSRHLLSKYCLPVLDKFRFSDHLMHSPSKENYRLWMHQMLYVEEMAQLEKIAKYNMTSQLGLVDNFLLIPGTMSSAKYAHDGELFARMQLDEDLSEDSVGGRLILQLSNSAWLAPHNPKSEVVQTPDKVYEVVVEEKGKDFIFLRLSSKCTSELKLKADQEFNAQVQFQLDRLPMCEKHAAVDALLTLDTVFPAADTIPLLPPVGNWEWKEDIDKKLNERQKDAIIRICAHPEVRLPPLLIIGPFGTGKTYTLAQAAKQVLQEPDTRVLICTHSNSAADLYIKDFLHPYVKEGNLEARPLRVYYRHRWVQTVSETVLQYCILETTGTHAGKFRPPEVEDLKKHRIVIATLSTARYMSDLDLPSGFFTHIFLDEAAQALECEMLIPLSLVTASTRVVLAGDHMQMSPEVYSDFARQQQFQKSLIERLYDLYPDNNPCKIMLCENYRSNSAITDFTSELFYENRLVACGDNTAAHSVYYPLTFFTARGEDVQHPNSTGYYNIAEIYEIIEQVEHLQKNWPQQWGEFDENSIGIVAQYSDQVIRIRSELRKKRLQKVSVERVFNVQGKQFRVLIISTVRTRHTINSSALSASDNYDFGFLSNVKLLNTAITRAQSLCVVVGDPVSLCLVGKCSKVWEYYLEVCNDHDSFFGMTWPHLRSLLNNVEMTKTYVLNPLAPEFIPNRYYPAAPGGQPIYHVPGHHGNMPYSQWGHRQMGQQAAGLHYQQIPYHHAAAPAYVPYMYPYQPYYGPVMYRPHPGAYPPAPHIAARGASRGHPRYPHGAPPVQVPKPKTGDTDEQTKSESPKAEGGHVMYATPTGRRGGQHGRPKMVYMPRMPMGYQPYYMYPHTYFVPEDPVTAKYYGMHGPPYYYNYPPGGAAPRHVLHPAQPRPGSGSVSPASSSEGTPKPAHQTSPDRIAAGSPAIVVRADMRPYSPALSPSSTVSGQQIQLLPNVKHIPSHLFGTTPGSTSGSNSRSSTPHAQLASPVTAQDESAVLAGSDTEKKRTVPIPIQGPYSRQTGQSPLARSLESPREEMEDYTKKQVSPVSQSPVYSSQSSHESSVSPVLNGEKGDTSGNVTFSPSSSAELIGRQKAARKQLRLNTGFSRQFSDDLGTPTEITNLVRMIEDNIDEKDEELVENTDFDDRLKPISQSKGRHLRLNISAAPQQTSASLMSQSSSDTSSADTEGDMKPTYAGIVRRALPTPDPNSKFDSLDPILMEPQTPMTPAGFLTPGEEVNADPLDLLKNLTLERDTLNQSTHTYFTH